MTFPKPKLIKKQLLSTKFFVDNKEFKEYFKIMNKNIDRKINKGGKTNKHHIFPKCVSKILHKSINNNSENIINLLFKDHILAHYYLCLSCNNKNLFIRLQQPLTLLLKNFKQAVNLRDIKTKKFLLQILNKLQKIHNKRAEITKKIAFEFYCKMNKELDKGKSFPIIIKEKFPNLNWKTVYGQYTDIVNKYKWKNHNTFKIWTDEENMNFYNDLNEWISSGKTFYDYDRKMNRKLNWTAKHYYKIIEKYNLPNKSLNRNTQKEQEKKKDLKLYNKINSLRSQGYPWKEIAKILNLKVLKVEDKYKKICVKHGWKSKNKENNNKLLLKKWQKDYDLISKLYRQGFTSKEVAKQINKNYKELSHYYCFICRKLNLSNQNPFHCTKYSIKYKQEFYNKVSTMLQKGLTFIEIDIKLNKKRGYSNQFYATCCKDLKLESKYIDPAIRWSNNKKLSIEFYNKCNEYFKQNMNCKDIDRAENTRLGYTRSTYVRICKCWNWKNKSPFRQNRKTK